MFNQKTATFLVLLTAVLVSTPKVFSDVRANTVLRYAQNDLGAADVSTSDFNFNGNNVTVSKNTNKGLVMTTGGSQASSIFLKEQMASDPIRPGFSTYFVMNVYKLSPGPADGYMFVIAANSNSLGEIGGGLGYTGILNSVGIEFDFYNNGGVENIASSDVFTNGTSRSTPGTVFDANFLTRWTSVTTNGNLVRAFHTWIEYDHANGQLELRVALSNEENPSVNRPSRPSDPLLTRQASYQQISNFFYAGFTAATGGQMQQMALKSWYFSNAYVAGGIDPNATDIVIDNVAPTAPDIFAVKQTSTYTLSISGGSDNNGISGYQYKGPNGNWTAYTGPLTITTVGEYQARTIDQAGNYSTSSQSIWLFQIHYYVSDLLVQSTYWTDIDGDFAVDYQYTSNNFVYQEWFDNATLTGTEVENIPTRTTSISLYGRGQRVAVNVDYVLNGGSLLIANPNIYTFGEPFLLNEPSLEGHTFERWYLDEGLTIPFDVSSIPETDFTLFAAFAVNLYQVTLYVNDTFDHVIQETIAYGTNLSTFVATFSDYQKVGHTFNGWYLDEAFTIPLIEAMTLTTALTLFGNWQRNTYTVFYMTNDDQLYGSAQFDYEDLLVFPEAPTQPGFSFAGWASQGALLAEYSEMPANDLTLIAIFTRNQYGLIFQGQNGVNFESYLLPFETDIATYLPETPAKVGHTFIEWTYDVEGQESFSGGDVLYDHTTLYAQWSINSYTLTFDSNAEEDISPILIPYQSPVLLPDEPSKTGYTFMGWFLDEERTIPYALTTMPAEDVRLYAGWLINQYTVNFESNGGTTIDAWIEDFDATLASFPIPEKVGHTFLGWYLDMQLSNEVNMERMPATQVTLYAKWEINTYRISFSSAHLSSAYAIVEVVYGANPLLPPSPNRVGYIFSHWSIEGTAYHSSWSMPAYDVVFEANWIPLQTQIILITPTHSTIITVTSGQPIGTLPTLAMKPGYLFLGWALTQGDAQTIIDDQYVVDNGETIRLYPIWEKTSNPGVLFNQILALTSQQIIHYTYEIIVFTFTMIVGLGLFIGYRKRGVHGNF